jgi:hypothetical protein
MHTSDVLLVVASFTGLFVWNAANNNSAGFCQLSDTKSVVSGDCYIRSVDVNAKGGFTDTHISVEGVRDGERVALRVRGLLGTERTWGTATLNRAGFVLEAARPDGVQQFEFIQSSAAVGNSTMAGIQRRGHAVQTARWSAMKRQETLENYRDLETRLPLVEKEIIRARSDSLKAEEKLAGRRGKAAAIRDSIARESVDWKRGALEGNLGAALGQVNDEMTSVQWATERIVQESGYARDMRSQMKADSLYLVQSKH